jgi:trk system potassium uptake protein
MLVIIVGGGRVGAHLAGVLVNQGQDVRLIEGRPDVLARIHHELPTEVIVEGDFTRMEVLEQAGIRDAQAVAACSASDEDNLAICYLARERYKVPRTIARINNPRSAWLFDEKFHVDVALNQAELMSSLILEEISMGDMMTLLKLRRGSYSLVEEKIPEGARAIGVAIKDLALPEHTVIAAIIRRGEVVVPRGQTTFEAGDEVLAVADPDGAEQLVQLFARHNNSH